MEILFGIACLVTIVVTGSAFVLSRKLEALDKELTTLKRKVRNRDEEISRLLNQMARMKQFGFK